MPGFTYRRFDLALTILLTFVGTAHAGDISLLSDMGTLSTDFKNPAIPSTEALIIQSGNANIATIDQQSATLRGGNYSEINQYGASNQSSVVQTGDSNRVRIDQTGSSNLAYATQSGSGNSTDLAQTGDANLFQASQIGDNNNIVANQNGVPTTTLVESGDRNSITVNLGPTQPIVSISIIGNGMSVTAH